MAGNLMSTMKKLSLNQFQRHDMLEKGLISWLTKHMEVVERTASPFHMECTTDLLRMLINDQNSVELVEESVSDLIMVLGTKLLWAVAQKAPPPKTLIIVKQPHPPTNYFSNE